ncbi:hypothetical protein E2C01_044979 [Portunus trituberculatus]|uniref:Uncharacterized protein n=1 Tax=Portunus trituberculatus TaxID=210409 RepID=A0A5B7G0V9_PORTR|nr:hypothetical protein [Portunus trituberculatus]
MVGTDDARSSLHYLHRGPHPWMASFYCCLLKLYIYDLQLGSTVHQTSSYPPLTCSHPPSHCTRPPNSFPHPTNTSIPTGTASYTTRPPITTTTAVIQTTVLGVVQRASHIVESGKGTSDP